MQEPIQFKPEYVSVDRSCTQLYYVFYRDPAQGNELFLRTATPEVMGEVIQNTVKRLGCAMPKNAYESFPLLIREGVMVCAYAHWWAEAALLSDAWKYGVKAADRARELVKINCTKMMVDKARVEYEKGSGGIQEVWPDEPCYPFLKDYSLDDSVVAFVGFMNDDFRGMYRNRGHETDHDCFVYGGIYEDLKFYLLQLAESKMKAGIPISFSQQVALQSSDAARLLGYKYTEQDINRIYSAHQGRSR